MTTTKRPTHDWLTPLLQACTAPEQRAIREYRCHTGRAHHKHRNGQLNRAQVTKAWTKALNRLEAEATGTPKFDGYVQRQQHHLEQWLTGEATSGTSA